MKKINFVCFVLFFSGLVGVSGCRKDSAPTSLNFPNPFVSLARTTTDPVDNYIVIHAIQQVNTPNVSPSFVHVGASFKNGTTSQNAGTLSVAGNIAKMDSYGNYGYNYKDSNQLSQGAVLPGTTFSVSISGSANVPAFSTNVYMPKRMVSTPMLKSYHSGTTDFTLNWTPDVTPIGQICIILERYEKTGLSTDYRQMIVPDNGTYTIPAIYFGGNWLSGTKFIIRFGRLTETIVTTGARKTYIWAISSATTGTMVIL